MINTVKIRTQVTFRASENPAIGGTEQTVLKYDWRATLLHDPVKLQDVSVFSRHIVGFSFVTIIPDKFILKPETSYSYGPDYTCL